MELACNSRRLDAWVLCLQLSTKLTLLCDSFIHSRTKPTSLGDCLFFDSHRDNNPRLPVFQVIHVSMNVFLSGSVCVCVCSVCVCVCSLQITGRMDDVINVAGHRLATGEGENVLCSDELVSEAAVCLCMCVDVRLDVS